MSFLKTGLSLRDKFILGFLAVVCFTGFSASLAGRYLINKMVMEETRQRVNSDLNASWGLYNQFSNNIDTKIQLTANRFFLRNNLPHGDLDKVKNELTKVSKEEGFDLLILTDSQGTVLYRTHYPDTSGDDISHLPLIMHALQGHPIQATFLLHQDDVQREGESIVQKTFIRKTDAARSDEERSLSPEVWPALVMGASAPVIDDNGTLLGVLAGGVILNNNFALVDRIKDIVFKDARASDSKSEVITIFLHHIRIATTLSNADDGYPSLGTYLPDESVNVVLDIGRPHLERSFIAGDWYLTAYKPIKNISSEPIGVLGVGVFEKKYQFMKEEVIMVFLSLTFLAMILALAISFLLARNITQPVNVLAQKAELIGSGNFVEIEPPSRDEIGSFAETFNKMSRSLRDRDKKLQAQTGELLRTKEELERTNVILLQQSSKLKRSVKELTVLFEASRQISSSLSLSEILDAIMDLLMDKFQTDTWSIRLLDDDGYLRIKSQRGLSDEFVKSADRKPTMDSYSGECFLTNKIIIVKDASKVNKPISTNLEVCEGIKSFGLVPIAIEDDLLGVLAGASKEKRGFFTEDYADFISSLAQQLAVAIRNARFYEKVKSFSEELEKEVAKRTEELRVKSQLLAQSEKLAALGEMADRVAHETRNPIVTIGGFARRIRRNLPDDDPLVRYIDIIIKEVERLEKMIFWITEYKKYISADFEPTDINTVIEEAIGSLSGLIAEHTVTIEKDLLRDAPLVRVDRKNMQFVFLNLFENSIGSMDSSGVLHVTTRLKSAAFIEIVISDTGKGLDADNLKSIYYPFFTSMLSGSGMGLTITHKIIKDHNGSLRVKSKPGEGSTFTVELPIITEGDTSSQEEE